MTGHRKNQDKPLKAVRRAELSWANYQRAVATAEVRPGLRVAAAADYLRAVLQRAAHDVAETCAATTCHMLVAEAQRLEAVIVGASGQTKGAER